MKGSQMYLSIIVFFVGIAMAIGGVYFYQRAQDTDYARLQVDLHHAKSEMKRAQTKLEEVAISDEKIQADFTAVFERLDTLEKKSPQVTVHLEPTKKPFLVEVVERPRAMMPAPAKLKVKAPRLAQ